jgi:hypothetical protein
MTLHDLPNHSLPLFIGLAQELICSSLDLVFLIFYLELSDRLDLHGYSLIGIQSIARGHVKAHQLQAKLIGALKQWPDHRAPTDDHLGTSASVHYERSIWADFSIQ